MRNKKTSIVSLVVLLAVIGTIAGVIVTRSSNDSSSTSEQSGNNSTSSSAGSSSSTSSTSGGTSTSKNNVDFTGTGSGSSSGKTSKVLPDPNSESYDLSAFAIGDWGATTYSKNGSCCSRRSDYYYNAFDRWAEAGVSKLMALTAAEKKPAVVLGHGDNFYWTGIQGPVDQPYRFEKTFESNYNDEAMIEVPWVNVMGNHDYGGGSYICADSDEAMAACGSTADLLQGLKTKFSLQSEYTSPNADRWILKDHFYVHQLSLGDVTIDVFNLDMNDADTHGADQICCQCYGYSEGDDKKCKTVTRGHDYCAGGDADMWDQCMDLLKQWGEDSKTQLIEGLAKSTATWKIVNSHYSPLAHYGETNGAKWIEALKEAGGVQLWIYGHTHGEKHDYASFGIHFIENGAGGGIQSESASGIPAWAKSDVENVWTAGGLSDGNAYGFFELSASENWLKARFLTFDSKWNLQKDDDGFENGVIGGVEAQHCWYIPVDGSKGEACSG